MKQLYFVLFGMGVFLFTSCGNNMMEKDTLFSDQEDLIQELNSELGLSRSQEDIVRERLHDSKELHAHPGSLWKLAASLYDILSDEQITKLLDGIKNGKFHDHAFNSEPENQPKHEKYFEYKMALLSEILNDTQMESIKGIIEDFKSRMEILGTQWKSEEITVEIFKANIFALKNYIKVSVANIMTEEQKVGFESKLEEMKTSKRHFGKHANNPDRFKAEKITALELTDEQLEQLEALLITFKSDLEALNQQFSASTLDEDAFINSAAELIQNKRSRHSEILTEKQNTIIKIHHALTVKAHKKYKFSDNG